MAAPPLSFAVLFPGTTAALLLTGIRATGNSAIDDEHSRSLNNAWLPLSTRLRPAARSFKNEPETPGSILRNHAAIKYPSVPTAEAYASNAHAHAFATGFAYL